MSMILAAGKNTRIDTSHEPHFRHMRDGMHRETMASPIVGQGVRVMFRSRANQFTRAMIGPIFAVLCLVLAISTMGATAHAESSENLQQAALNPIANLISVPFDNTMFLDTGLLDDTANTLEIKPVVPFSLNADWNLITRTITPVVYIPPLFPGDGNDFGLGDLQPSLFLSPKNPTPLSSGVDFVWGAGAALAFPTSTSPRLGTEKWSAGPTFVALLLTQKIVTGVLINNVWSFAGESGRANVNAMTLEPFFNYNFPQGWYLTVSPTIEANWEEPKGERWKIPVGGGIGRVFKIGKQPINAQINYYYNIESPSVPKRNLTGGNHQLGLNWTFLLPTH